MLLGVLAGVAGFGILKGQTWSRVVGIGFALLSMAIQFLIIPLYPVWSLLMIVLDIAIIFGLATSAATLNDRSSQFLRPARGPAACGRSVRRLRIRRMVRLREYFQDPSAPRAHDVLPAAFAAVRNSAGELLLVRRIDDDNWELPGGRIEVGESAGYSVCG